MTDWREEADKARKLADVLRAEAERLIAESEARRTAHTATTDQLLAGLRDTTARVTGEVACSCLRLACGACRGRYAPDVGRRRG